MERAPHAALRCLVLACLILTAGCGDTLRTTVEFSRDEIQERVEKEFPLKEKNALFALDFSRPQVLLHEGTNRMGLVVDVSATLLGSSPYQGQLELDGRLDYRPEEGAIFLVDTHLRRFELQGVSSSYLKQIETVVGSALKEFLERQPVYALDPEAFGHSLAKLALKSVRVENAKVVAEIGL